MSRRPSRRALPPDRFGEAAADEDLFQALTSSSSEDEGDDGGAGGGAAARRRVTTTTVDESDDDAGGSDAGGDSENIRGAASTESSDRPNSDSECDGTRDLVPLCEREMGKRGEAAEQARSGNDAVEDKSKPERGFSLFTEIKTQANAFSLAHPRPFEPKSTTKNFAQRKPRPRTRSSTAFCAPRTSSRSSTDARYREKKEEGKWRMTRRESARARERGGQR
jgi:hypothetical protein